MKKSDIRYGNIVKVDNENYLKLYKSYIDIKSIESIENGIFYIEQQKKHEGNEFFNEVLSFCTKITMKSGNFHLTDMPIRELELILNIK